MALTPSFPVNFSTLCNLSSNDWPMICHPHLCFLLRVYDGRWKLSVAGKDGDGHNVLRAEMEILGQNKSGQATPSQLQ